MRQRFFEKGDLWSNAKLYYLLADNDAYKQMPSSKIVCSLIRQFCQAWTRYFKAHNDRKINHNKYYYISENN
jgi:hypothetical protein